MAAGRANYKASAGGHRCTIPPAFPLAPHSWKPLGVPSDGIEDSGCRQRRRLSGSDCIKPGSCSMRTHDTCSVDSRSSAYTCLQQPSAAQLRACNTWPTPSRVARPPRGHSGRQPSSLGKIHAAESSPRL